MTPKRIRLFQWIAVLCVQATAGFGSRCAAQSKTPERSEGERLLDGRDAIKVEWYTERSVVVAPPSGGGGGCMFCRPAPKAAAAAPRTMIVQDNSIVWLDAATKLPLKQVSPNGMTEHYRSTEINRTAGK